MEELRANGRLDVVDDAVRCKKASHRLSIGIVDDMESGGIDVNPRVLLENDDTNYSHTGGEAHVLRSFPFRPK